MSGVLVQSLHYDEAGNQKKIIINDRETEFLKLACTELTYKEIADRMCLAPERSTVTARHFLKNSR